MTDDNDPTTSVVDLFELHLLDFFENEIPDPITHVTIPRDVARAVLDLAKKGQRVRGQRPLSEVDKLCQESVIDWAKQRKADLRAASPNMNAAQATLQAAADAKRLLLEDYGMNLKASTIKRRMD